ncbi:MAG: hypothetical protein NXI31_07945 [bacterium]|nr:hypothetical protein [bacterium]
MKLLHAAVVLASTMLCVLGQGIPRPLQDPAPLDPAAAGPAMRIWSHRELGMQEVWFRREFKLTAVPDEATFVFSCDNEATVFVNGKRVAHSEHWEELTVVDVTRLLVKGKNVIAIHAKNTGSCAALAAWLTWESAAKKAVPGVPAVVATGGEIVTDADWVYADEEHDDWAAVAFDASKWNAANATLETPFGNNVYNGKPLRLRFENGRSASAQAIERALAQFRAARTPAAAQKALDALDRAVMDARARLWKEKGNAAKKGGVRVRKRD